MKSARYLNLGSGQRKIAHAINIDINPQTKPDIVHDLDIFPYPIPDNQFEIIYCYDILEHLEDLIGAMKELHRISKKGTKIIIESPHFSYVNAYTDPTHKHYFGLFSFDYFTQENQWGYYTENKFLFKTVERKLFFQKGLFKKAFEWLFNRHPHFYETKLTWLIPAEKIRIILKVFKAP